ncbi:thiosulfate/3-mercaptopyruvate sulfurtransferase [Flavobacterium nitrogenifigens]|uniref:Thiosulfate/3-mercaptopyruvate sulfurtransferase n=2 Tax=Flavobacterium TaxID=237 RepID=A0A7W7N821_9FLAO|nr:MULTISPECIES: sulfurtransferase [Flavobacterium]MBB4803388.1 thiosulfate/3-mercaptopyruvate sulfurtransferase [Flavobacterium nitrogenifigens]MBB6388346.1 thiosulfate/3-mercaptopyruvate sulfurtransferase [Flavobacterium notoginsengisoli]
MSTLLSPIISAEELNKLNLFEIILIDARAGSNAFEVYQKEHLKGARFVDLNQDLASIPENPANGGRHPLPTNEQFAETLSKLGISPSDHIIVYDDKNGSNFSARFWWMMRAVGHEKIQVLNGGYQAALQNDFPTSSETETFQKTTYPIQKWKLPLADIEDVEKARKSNQNLVIDVRDKNRFDGLTEPLDLIAGHIPGAINIPLTENLDENGFFKSAEELGQKYKSIVGDKKDENIIVHCGSGVTACHTLLAMDYAGIAIPKLYVGSWSEWSRNDREMATQQKE